MKSIFTGALILLTIQSCQNQNKPSDKYSDVVKEAPNIYENVNDSIGLLAKDILSSFKTNNYASFSNYLSSKDTLLSIVDEELKEETMSEKEAAAVKQYMSEDYTKRIITTKTDFDYIIKKGMEEGIIWSNVNYDGTNWTLSKDKDLLGNFSYLNLDLKINFKYKGVGHYLRFDNKSFIIVNSKWILVKDFYLDNFSPSDETAPATDRTVPSIPNMDSEEPMRDTSKMMMDNSQK